MRTKKTKGATKKEVKCEEKEGRCENVQAANFPYINPRFKAKIETKKEVKCEKTPPKKRKGAKMYPER